MRGMGLFQNRPEEEEKQWAGLPSEPLDHASTDLLDAPLAADPMTLGLGTSLTSVAIPVTAPASAVAAADTREPDDETAD